ncbi:MAG: hypothetical protein WCC36_00530 [Gammaproteobacteria bacterium]
MNSPSNPLSVLIGIDDTDNLESRGTGFRARQLGQLLMSLGLGRLRCISRHQLFVSPRIPYTSHNSSACLQLDADDGALDALASCCRRFLARESAPGSDAGLCMGRAERIPSAVARFGRDAKRTVLSRDEATGLAQRRGLLLEGLTGDHNGVIGALAAVGLHTDGNDGRLLWLPGLREAACTQQTVSTLKDTMGIDALRRLDGVEVGKPEDIVDLGPWPRAVRQSGRAILLVEDTNGHQTARWRVASKPLIKAY